MEMDLLNDQMMQLMNEFYNTKEEEEINKEKNNNIKCINDNCSSNNFVLDECNYVCIDCGTLQERYIDDTAEWRFYGSSDTKSSDPTRCGMPTNELFPEFSLGSVISYDYGKKSSESRDLCKYQKWNSTCYRERALYTTVEHIYAQANNSGIPNTIIDEAKTMYKALSEQSLHRGSSRCGIIASCLYWSCKRNKVPRSSKEIAKMFNINPITMTKGVKLFQNAMKINADSTTAKDFIIRFCSNLNLDEEIVDICIRVVDKIEEYGIVSENSPPSIASGIIYLACEVCNFEINKKQISQTNAISEVTINKTYKKLYKYRSIILPPDIIHKYSVK
jgi:transcription initiation factor TFIIIB Brf1 subunit/transcription initiation factor TFIIB